MSEWVIIAARPAPALSYVAALLGQDTCLMLVREEFRRDDEPHPTAPPMYSLRLTAEQFALLKEATNGHSSDDG